MGVRLRLGELNLEANSRLWSVDESGEEPVLQLTGHTKVEHIRDSQHIESGRPGFFVGTATDATFRRVRVRAI